MTTAQTRRNLAKLFAPRGIAVVGVSQDPTKIGSTIFSNLIASNYGGKLVPVNPKYQEVFGYKCYKGLEKIPHRIDMAIMAIPGEFALDVVKDCHKKGIPNLVIISAGFSEVGGKGVELEQKLASYAEKYKVTILGPNCLGLLVTSENMNASFSAVNAAPGDVAFMSQSGAVCTAMLDKAAEDSFGFSHFVSIGNKLNLNENHLLDYWLQSEKVTAIGAYLEEFADGYDFIMAKRWAEREKPIVVIKPGKSLAAQKAISSHTGSLADNDAIVKTALRKHGITKVDDINEAYATLKAFSWSELPKGKRVAIVTNAGGPGIVSTDMAVAAGLELAEISQDTQSLLHKDLPAAASVTNPIDIIGDAPAVRYEHSITVLNQAKEVDAVIVILTPQVVTQIEDTAKLLINISKQAQKPIIPVFLGGKYARAGLERLADNQIPAFSELGTAVRVLAHLANYQTYLDTKAKSPVELGDYISRRSGVITSKLETLIDDSSPTPKAIPEELVSELLEKFEFTVPAHRVVHSLEEAKAALEHVNFPLVVKATTEDIVHKTDFKAIYLGISSESELEQALSELQGNIYARTKREHPPVLMQEMIDSQEELFIGARRDGGADVYDSSGRGFGYLLLFGKGGIYTEVYHDISAALLPLTKNQIKKLVDSVKVAEIVHGARGHKALAVNKLVDTILRLQKMLLTYPQIKEVDFNPVMLSYRDCYAVDTKIFV